MMRRVLFVMALLLACSDARADPITFVVALAPYIGGAAAATLYSAGAFLIANSAYIALAYSVYSGVQAGRAARAAERQARADYNNGLQDRMITAVSEAPPERVVYGAGLYGGDVVAIFTSDYTDENGTVKTDGLKHLVVICASHRVKSIKDVLIDGTRCGVTGSAGWSNSSDFSKGYENTKTSTFAGTGASQMVGLATYTGGRVFGTLMPEIVTVQANFGDTVLVASPSDYSLSGATLTLPASLGGTTITSAWTWHVTYSFGGASVSEVYISKFLGSDTQTADSWLMSQVPSLWLSTDRLRGRAGAVITLNLKQQRFQGGIPRILFDLEGRDEIYDPRDGTYKYTTNAALCTDDWLRSRWGFGVVPIEAATIVAANACDVSIPFTVYAYPPDGIGPPGPTTGSAARYTINGSFTSDQDKESVLRDMLLSMGGKAINGAGWTLLAGAWTTPVRDIVDGDDMGPLQIAQAGAPMDEIFNGVRGTFIPYGESASAEINPPYQNTTFVTADGQELWENLAFPYTDNAARAANLARIAVEVARNGLTIVYPAKLKHWDLQVGQRVRVTNAEYGFTAKEFQILNWEFSQDAAVLLTLQEDAEAAYDLADAGIADPTPNSDLADPNLVPKLAGFAAVAGTAELDRRADGGIVSRMRVTWTTSTSPYMDGDAYVEVAWQNPSVNSELWNLVKVPPLDNEVLVNGVQDGTNVVVRVTVVNSLGRRSDPVFSSCYIFGKTAAPATITGFALSLIPGAMKGTCSRTVELDYGYTIYRYGVSFSTGVKVPGTSDANGFIWPWPALGSYTVWAADVDTSGNLGTPVSQTITVDSSILIGSSGITPSPDWLNSNVAIPRGTMNADPGLLDPANAWTWDAAINVQGPSGAVGALGCMYFICNAFDGGDKFATANKNFPIRSTGTYNYSALLYAESGNDRNMYLVVDMYKADGTQLKGVDTGWGGSFAGHSFGGLPAIGLFTRYGADFGAGTSRPIPDTAAYCKIHVWFQYSGGGSSSVPQAAEDIRLVDVTDARAAAAAAAAAQGTADAAAGNATTALGTLATMRSNGYLDASEKPAVIKQYQAIYDEQAGIAAQASAYGVTTERTAYISAFNALVSYLSSLSPAWNDTTSDTLITPAVDQATWAAYYSARQTVLNKIAEIAGTQAVWNSISGTGKPLDNAGKTVDLGGATGVFGARDRDDLPSEYPWGRSLQFKQASSIGLSGSDGTYCTLETLIQFVDDSGGPNVQYAYQGSKTWRRTALRTAGAWGSWTQDLDRNSYTGDLAATRNTVYYQDTDPGSVPDGSIWISSTKAYQRVSGAWQPYVGAGSINTNELAAAAATDVITVTTADVDIFSYPLTASSVLSISYTAPANCDVAITTAGIVDQVCVVAQYSTYFDISDAASLSFVATNERVRNLNTADAFAKGSLACSKRFAMTAGQTKTFYLMVAAGGFPRTGPQTGNACNLRNMEMRLEAIKK